MHTETKAHGHSDKSHGLDDHNHGHSPDLAHHFENHYQQHEAGNLGMWMFLSTEILFFGGMFGAYTVYRYKFEKVFEQASNLLDPFLGGINTIILLFSSVTMALAVRSAQVGNRKGIVAWMAATIVFGVAFLGVKAFEWKHDAAIHVFPTKDFCWSFARAEHQKGVEAHKNGQHAEHTEYKPYAPAKYYEMDKQNPEANQGKLFFFLYFTMTGLHGLHMVIGFGIMAVIMVYAWKGYYTTKYFVPVESIGLYWHFVDLVWIFLYPLLYLLGAHLQSH